jgi:hypothetical protein
MSNDAFDPARARSALQLTLGRVGRTNGHGPPSGGSNVDPSLHYLLADSDAYSFFDKQRKESLAAVLEMSPVDFIDDAVNNVIKTGVGTNIVVTQGKFYSLGCQIKRPSMRLDKTKLRSILLRTFGMKPVDLDQAFAEAETSSSPAKVFTVQTL